MIVRTRTLAQPTLNVGLIEQHYNPGSAMSTLAASVLAESERNGLTEADLPRVGQWIRENVDRVNFLMDEKLGMRVLTLLEVFLQAV